MSGYTSGPWRAEDADMFGDYAITQEGGGLAIAAVVVNLRGADEVSANAYLIAAAPELYEAAKDALVSAEHAGLLRTAKALRAAVAKAEGR